MPIVAVKKGLVRAHDAINLGDLLILSASDVDDTIIRVCLQLSKACFLSIIISKKKAVNPAKVHVTPSTVKMSLKHKIQQTL